MAREKKGQHNGADRRPTRLYAIRTSRGLSAAELAERVAVRRQTIYAIEDGSYMPNTAVALRLAQTLETTVEELFAQEEEPGPLERAELLSSAAQTIRAGQPVRLSRVNGRLVATPATAFPAFLPASDAFVESFDSGSISIRSPVHFEDSRKRLLLAGCDPALSLLTQLLAPAGFDILTVPCSSRRALEWLKQGHVHAAGSHLLDQTTRKYNVPLVQRMFPKGEVQVVNFATWEEGLLVAAGNPKNIESIADLARKNVSIINRETGAGSRDLLDNGLRQMGLKPETVAGYARIARGHLEAALAVAGGTADCCFATRSAARHFGLDFMPLSIERFDLSIPKAQLDLPPARALLDLLSSSALRKKLESIAQCDTTETGKILL